MWWYERNYMFLADRRAIFVDEKYRLMGVHNAQIIVLGTFWERKDANSIFAEAQYAQLP